MNRISDAAFLTWVANHPDWVREDETIFKTRRGDTFAAAMGFVTGIGVLADTADHHPDIDIRYRDVTVALTTHSEHALTTKDLELAAAIDALP
ncbi:MAG: 4a-hydroxytetrahydrobiopterin dehydratase [Actinobacteria bacterium]|nr:4a-hydroxytetrahydrobiopterin dehydratase [Actinomycetota bacterium]